MIKDNEELFKEARDFCISEDLFNYMTLYGNDYMIKDMFELGTELIYSKKISEEDRYKIIEEITNKLNSWNYTVKERDEKMPESIHKYIHRYHMVEYNEKSIFWMLRYFQYMSTLAINSLKYTKDGLLSMTSMFSGGIAAFMVKSMVESFAKSITKVLDTEEVNKFKETILNKTNAVSTVASSDLVINNALNKGDISSLLLSAILGNDNKKLLGEINKTSTGMVGGGIRRKKGKKIKLINLDIKRSFINYY